MKRAKPSTRNARRCSVTFNRPTRKKIEALGRRAAGCKGTKRCRCPFCAPAHNAKVIYKACDSDQFYTPASLRVLVWAVLGVVGLDPATSKRNPLRALKYFTTGALEADWVAALESLAALPGERTWFLNPPFGYGIAPWLALVAQLVTHCPLARGLLLIPARPGAGWYKRITRKCQLLCELDGRVTFEDARGKPIVSLGKRGNPKPTPARWGVALLYFGPDRANVARLLAPYAEVRWCSPSPRGPRSLPKPDSRQVELAFDSRAFERRLTLVK
jgi:hypothetical protein